jgi:hypothetical protein
VTGGKLIAVLLQSIAGVSAINPLVAFCEIHGGKREVLFIYFVPDTTRKFIAFTITCSHICFKSILGCPSRCPLEDIDTVIDK